MGKVIDNFIRFAQTFTIWLKLKERLVVCENKAIPNSSATLTTILYLKVDSI